MYKYLFSILFFYSSLTFAVIGDCNLGYQNPTLLASGCHPELTTYENKTCDYQVANIPDVNTSSDIYFWEDHPTDSRIGIIYKVSAPNCARSKSDFQADEGCFSADCAGTKNCNDDSDTSFTVVQGDTCENKCKFTNPNISAIELSFCDQPPPPLTGSCQNDSSCDWDSDDLVNGGPTGEWDCLYEPFMCAYDTDNDGAITLDDDRESWPDPTDGMPSGDGCISYGSEICGPVEDHHGEDSNGDGIIGDPDDVGTINPDGSVGSSGGGGGEGGSGIVDAEAAEAAGLSCPLKAKMYCNSQDYESYGYGYGGPACQDGNEVLTPARKCSQDLGVDDVSEFGDTIDQELLRELKKEAREQNMTLKGLLEAMDAQRRAIIEANSKQTSELGDILREIASKTGTGSGSGSGGDGTPTDDPTPIDLEPVVTELQTINETLNSDRSTIEKGVYEDIEPLLETVKQEYESKIALIKNDMTNILNFNSSTNVQSLTCSTSFVVLGTEIPFCISRYENEIRIIGNALVALSLILSVFIMLGGVRT